MIKITHFQEKYFVFQSLIHEKKINQIFTTILRGKVEYLGMVLIVLTY